MQHPNSKYHCKSVGCMLVWLIEHLIKHLLVIVGADVIVTTCHLCHCKQNLTLMMDEE